VSKSKPLSASSTTPSTVQTIGTVYLIGKNWKETAGISGLEFSLDPKDNEDNSVQTDGIISAKLWKEVQINFENKCLKRPEDLLDHWDNVQINKDDFGFMGTTVRLEYKNYKPIGDQYAMGCADITFTTPDGKIFESSDDSIFINEAF
ncbi:MAG: hypothetical protein PHW73_12645, partial [Atribacterota bacterium]|nr:hypothetical protein [Atribacterota bacterium]